MERHCCACPFYSFYSSRVERHCCACPFYSCVSFLLFLLRVLSTHYSRVERHRCACPFYSLAVRVLSTHSYPSRYQSDEVDRPDGQLVRHANRDLRRAIFIIAENLVRKNQHFGILAAGWRAKDVDYRDICVRVAGRFCRIAFQMVAGNMTYRHPCNQQRDYMLTKLIRFSIEHEIFLDQLMRNLDAATVQLPSSDHPEEAASLAQELARLQTKRGSGPKALAEILPAVLAKLGVKLIPSTRVRGS